jgi:integrase
MLVGLCGVLRVFLRYLFREKLIAQDLSQTIEGPRVYRLSSIPRSISWTEVERMLAAVDRRSVVGKRDYAILLLLVTYGLRGREVAALTLDDLDWERERLKVPERKAGHSTAYPLSPIVGQAIIDYLKNGRPQRSDRHIFYRVTAPFDPMTNGGVSTRASYYLHKAGVPVPRPGSLALTEVDPPLLTETEPPGEIGVWNLSLSKQGSLGVPSRRVSQASESGGQNRLRLHCC